MKNDLKKNLLRFSSTSSILMKTFLFIILSLVSIELINQFFLVTGLLNWESIVLALFVPVVILSETKIIDHYSKFIIKKKILGNKNSMPHSLRHLIIFLNKCGIKVLLVALGFSLLKGLLSFNFKMPQYQELNVEVNTYWISGLFFALSFILKFNFELYSSVTKSFDLK
jgi:hypothetical protein